MSKQHLKDLIKDEKRNSDLVSELGGLVLDFTHSKLDSDAFKLLEELVAEAKIPEKIE